MSVRFCCVVLLLIFAPFFGLAEDTIYTVRKGETVYSIARSYGITPDEILRQNGITDPTKLQAGQRIRIPQGRSTGGWSTEYRVNRGDTLSGIARRYGVTLADLRAVNGFSESHVLKEGERIKVPFGQVESSLPPAVSGETPVAGILPGDLNFGDIVTRTTPAASGLDSSLRWPVAAKEIMYITGKLYGVALLGERAEPVKSLTQGTVVSAGPYRGFGRVAIVQMEGGYLYVYGGCESLSVKEGDRVGPGTELGKLGIDSVSETPRLFFLVYQSNTPIDPAKAPRA
ncbi:MAG: M23 family metallopeptidase [Treponema sp.]|jgi:murein DD-endopeptidase MepM/ murein hydrolase activator NlpD|nr:M23 family metallopeptidase [Treponema sp.]